MSVLTNYAGNAMISAVIETGTTYYVALFQADPTALGSFANEVAGGSYARQPSTFSAPSGKTTGNSVVLIYTNMPACTVRYIGICKTLTGTTNDLLTYGQVTDIVVADGKSLSMEVNDVTLTL